MGREILPHERDLRVWLQRRLVAGEDVEDIVQECYCRLAQLPDVAHIDAPRAYLFTMARNLLHRQRRNARVVRIEPIDGPEAMDIATDLPSPEQTAGTRRELERVRTALAVLSERSRRIFLMRRVEGLSQKEIAATLGVTEAVVENEASRSLRAILRMMTETERRAPDREREAHARSR
ncbi:RNA polymerase sigma factor [Sphingomonas sp. VNH70]|uniref:RNA polymerase sigma factor n=1 Tax=Sphingomonas silueang TaxID=3156617 RepID=UPI0032B625E2